MGEHLLKIMLGELALVRVKCARCGVAVEVPLDKLGGLDDVPCPGKCGTIFGRAMPGGPRGSFVGKLDALERAVSDLQQMNDLFLIEFPISLDSREELAK